MAVLSGTPNVVALHLDRGVHPDAQDAAGQTALMLAAARGRTEVCRLLLARGAALGVADPLGHTAFSLAFEAGYTETADLLAAGRSPAPELHAAPAASPPIMADDSDGLDLWETEAVPVAPHDDERLRISAAAAQEQVGRHQARGLDADWSDVVVELPASRRKGRSPGRARDSVRFRRLRKGASARSLQDAMVALDLSRTPDELLNVVTLAQVIRCADTSIELQSCARRSDLFSMCTAEFLADDDGEARFLEVPGLGIEDYLELADLMNAFTVLVHREAAVQHHPPAVAPGRPEMRRPLHAARDPDEILGTTLLAQIILSASPSALLRRTLSRSERFNMSAAAFLQEDDGEALFRDVPGLGVQGYIELADLVNDFTARVYQDAQRGRVSQVPGSPASARGGLSGRQ